MSTTTLPETRYALHRDGTPEPLSTHETVEWGRDTAHRAVREDPEHRYLLVRDGRIVATFAHLSLADDLGADRLAEALAVLS